MSNEGDVCRWERRTCSSSGTGRRRLRASGNNGIASRWGRSQHHYLSILYAGHQASLSLCEQQHIVEAHRQLAHCCTNGDSSAALRCTQ